MNGRIVDDMTRHRYPIGNLPTDRDGDRLAADLRALPVAGSGDPLPARKALGTHRTRFAAWLVHHPRVSSGGC